MNIVRLHELIEEWAAEERKGNEPDVVLEADIVEEPKRELPEGKRVVRTKTHGDKVFYLDEVKKTRQWVVTPEVLQSLKFEATDVEEVLDGELLKYQMASPISRPLVDATT